jgi:3'(2'), 5'-bisphosphate nucleotidase
MTTDPELECVLSIARRAARLILEIYATPFEVELKGPGDPVTRADREANTLICDALRASFPADAILAEESVPTSPREIAERVRQERVFFVDPLDGTREFVARNGEFAVMIGLAVRGRAALGVVVEPTTGQAFAGRVGQRGFVETADGMRSPLRVSGETRAEHTRMLASRSHPAPIVELVRRDLRLPNLIACGSVGVKAARIATNQADLYVHGGSGGSLWDTCGPEAIVHSAGGVFTDLDGTPIDYTDPVLTLRKGIVAASTRALHDAVVAVTRERATRSA